MLYFFSTEEFPDDAVSESRPKSRERSSLIIDNELFVGGGIMPARVSDWFEQLSGQPLCILLKYHRNPTP